GVAWARFSTCRRWCSVSRRRASAVARSSSVNKRRDSYWVCTRKMALASTARSRTRFSRTMPSGLGSALGHAHDGAARARVGPNLGGAGLDAIQSHELHGLRLRKRGAAVVDLLGVFGDELLDDAVFERMKADDHQ